jgi:hypothetical protein
VIPYGLAPLCETTFNCILYDCNYNIYGLLIFTYDGDSEFGLLFNTAVIVVELV